MDKNANYNLADFGLSNEELFAKVDHNDVDSEKIAAPRYSYWRSVFRVFFKKKINIVILSVLAFVIIFAYIYPAIFKYDQFANVMAGEETKHLSTGAAFNKFGASIHYLFGTGSYGEATFDAVWYGARISLSLALVCALINMTIGVVLGAVWGFSKRFDIFMTEVYNIVGNVPYTLFISVMVMILSASFWSLVFSLTVYGWLGIAYFIRTQVIIIRDREYNLASKCLGTSTFKIATKNILPFMTSVIVTLAATEIPSYISTEVFLSYIGLGLKDVSLGRLIDEAKSSMFIPGWEKEFWYPVAISAVVSIVLYVAGQNLGDASDPRTHM